MSKPAWYKKHFGYSRLEFRGLVILIVLLGIVITIRIIQRQPAAEYTLHRIADQSVESNSLPSSVMRQYSNDSEEDQSQDYHLLDPNTATLSELVAIGIPDNVAASILHYRLKGGHFKKPEGLLKLHAFDSSLLASVRANLLDEFISLPEETELPIVKVELNTVDSAKLIALPGIGTVLSARILKYRNWLGGFYCVDQLAEVYGISDSLVFALTQHLTVDTTKIHRININAPEQKALFKHPYLNKNQAKAIQSYRRLSGEFTSLSQLREYYLLSEDTYQKVAPYLSLN